MSEEQNTITKKFPDAKGGRKIGNIFVLDHKSNGLHKIFNPETGHSTDWCDSSYHERDNIYVIKLDKKIQICNLENGVNTVWFDGTYNYNEDGKNFILFHHTEEEDKIHGAKKIFNTLTGEIKDFEESTEIKQ